MVGHKKQWEFFKKKLELNQLSHAYLFSGAKEIGKKTFAIELVKLVNCIEVEASAKATTSKIEKSNLRQGYDGQACQKCVNCQMLAKNNFPDFMLIKSENGEEIQISKIRKAQNFLSYKSYYGSFKTVIIDNAEKMNQEAQSCFLKTLEEPKGKSLLILISSKPDILLPTIISRCQTLKFFRSKDLPLNYEKLEEEKNIIKKLFLIFDSNFSEKFKYVKSFFVKGSSRPEGSLAEDYPNQEISKIIEVIQKYLRYILFMEAGIKASEEQENLFDGVPVSKKYSVKKIKNILNLIDDVNNKLIFTNANPKLALEVLLMEL